MFYNHRRQLVGQWDGSSPSLCPLCTAELTPKRGDIIRWHWAHKAATHARRGCPWEESAWHLRWKQVYLEMGWQIEAPQMIGRQRFILDAINLRTGRIREFVHSLSPYYADKHRALRKAGFDVAWLFDGHEFISARRQWIKKRGFRHFLKPRAFDVAAPLRAFVHDHELIDTHIHTLWRHWKANVWFPMEGEQSRHILTLFITQRQEETLA